MADPGGDIAPPSVLLLALEPRGLFSFARLIAAAPFLAAAPRGAAQAAIVLPGLGATDRSTAAIRAYLKFLGYEAHGWNRGRNVRPAGADLPAVAAQIRSLHEVTGTLVSLVGWSRGGIIAREAARMAPDAVRMVVSLRRAGGLECRHRLAPPDRGGLSGPDAAAIAGARRAPAGSLHLNLQPLRRRRRLAGVPAGGRPPERERGSAGRPCRARLQPRRAVGDRRPAGAAARDVGALPAERLGRRLVSARTEDPVLTPPPASLTFP